MTTAQQILTDAINRAIENDFGGSELAEDQSGEGLRVLNRIVQRIYGLAALPTQANGWGQQPFFLTSGTVTIGSPSTTLVNLPTTPRVARLVQLSTAGGTIVSIATLPDSRRGVLDYPPAVILMDQQLRCAGPVRVGDPVAGQVLTADYAYFPADLASLSQLIGAKLAADTTSQWPSQVGDQFLVDWMARYYAIKDDAARQDLGPLTEDLQADAETLAGFFGINAADLVTVLDA